MLGICLLASALAFVTLQFELVHPSTCPHRLGEEYNSVSLEPATDPDASTYSSHRVRIPPSHNLLLATSSLTPLLLSLMYSTKAWLGMAPLHPSASSTHETLDAPRLSLRSTMYKPNHTLENVSASYTSHAFDGHCAMPRSCQPTFAMVCLLTLGSPFQRKQLDAPCSLSCSLLFAPLTSLYTPAPCRYVRFSTSSWRAEDGPDVRGMAIKLMGVQGERAAGWDKAAGGEDSTQDFLLVSSPFFFPGQSAGYSEVSTGCSCAPG